MPEIIGDPDVVVSLARSRNKVDVLQGRFSLKLQTGEGSYTVPAAIDGSSAVRFELYTRSGPACQLPVTGTRCTSGLSVSGRSTRARPRPSSRASRGGSASTISWPSSRARSRCGCGDSPRGRTVFDEDGVVIVMLGPDDIRVRATIDPRLGLVRRLRVDPPGGRRV